MTRNLKMLRLLGVVALLVVPMGFSKLLSQSPKSDTSKPAQSDRLSKEAEQKARVVLESCVAMSTLFSYGADVVETKYGVGFVIESKNGQRILAMPSQLAKPVKSGSRGGSTSLIPVNSLTATRQTELQGDQDIESFRERVWRFDSSKNSPFLDNSAAQADSHKLPGSIQQAEEKIRMALLERREVNFNAVPLSGVLKFYKAEFDIPIVMDERALERALVTPDEPITLELPPVTFRSALNLILGPLNLDYVIEDEVLKITSKANAQRSKNNIETESVGVGVVGYQKDATKKLQLMPIERYQQRNQANLAGAIPVTLPEVTFPTRQDYWGITGPLSIHEVFDVYPLEVVLISFPGDVPAIPLPAEGTEGTKRFIRSKNQWIPFPTFDAQINDGAAVVDERGAAIGMLIGNNVVPFRQILKSLSDRKIDLSTLGYWGLDSGRSATSQTALDPTTKQEQSRTDTLQVSKELPELVTEEMRAQIKKAESLQGDAKVLAMVEITNQLGMRIQMRSQFADEKLESLRLKIQQLTSLTERMKQEDLNETRKIHPSFIPKLDTDSDPFSASEDPFKKK